MNSLKEALREALDEDDKTATAWLVEAKSYTKLNEDVGNAVRQLTSGDAYSYVVELFDDFVIYETGGDGNPTKYFKALYTVGVDGKVTLSGAVEVEKVTTYPTTTNTEAGKPVAASFVEQAGQLIPWEGE